MVTDRVLRFLPLCTTVLYGEKWTVFLTLRRTVQTVALCAHTARWFFVLALQGT